MDVPPHFVPVRDFRTLYPIVRKHKSGITRRPDGFILKITHGSRYLDGLRPDVIVFCPSDVWEEQNRALAAWAGRPVRIHYSDATGQDYDGGLYLLEGRRPDGKFVLVRPGGARPSQASFARASIAREPFFSAQNREGDKWDPATCPERSSSCW